MDWKDEMTLAELAEKAPFEVIEIERDGCVVLRSTPRELLREGRLPGFLSIAQVEFAFSGCKDHST